MKASLLERLRKQPDLYLRELPDTLRIPALENVRPETLRRWEDASVDDLAFAIQGIETEVRALHRRLGYLKDLHDLARKRGAYGTTLLADVFADPGEVNA